MHSLILALALCHSVTPSESLDGALEYQASSPDEIALVKYAEACGAQLVQRDAQSMTVRVCGCDRTFHILAAFPFSSETKRMGIVLRCTSTGTITFYVKGADAVMSRIVRYSEWLEEECGNLSREGLRTLVVGSRVLTEKQYETFAAALRQAKATLHDRQANVQAVADTLEEDVALLGVTGVDDRLQDGVRQCLETLRNAGVRVWMLTGDKIETATCIARSARLVDRMQPVFTFVASSKDDAADQLMRYRYLSALVHSCARSPHAPSPPGAAATSPSSSKVAHATAPPTRSALHFTTVFPFSHHAQARLCSSASITSGVSRRSHPLPPTARRSPS